MTSFVGFKINNCSQHTSLHDSVLKPMNLNELYNTVFLAIFAMNKIKI